MTVPADPVWYFWPITTAVLATALAIHLYYLADRNGRQAMGVPLPVLGVVSLSIPFVALSFSLHNVACTDTGQSVDFTPGLLVVVAVITWTGILCALYKAAGHASAQAAQAAFTVLLATAVAVVVEVFVSTAGLEGYCNQLGHDWQYGQLAVALLGSVGTGWGMVWWLRNR